MGTLLGHLVPGTMFIFVSLWWFIGEILQRSRGRQLERARSASSTAANQRSNSIQPVWYLCHGSRFSKFPVEPAIKVFFAVLGVIGELPGSKSSALYDSTGDFSKDNIDNYAHSVMYCFFGLSGVVDLVMWYNLISLPPKFDYLVFSVALWIEGFLFFFHLHGRDELNVRLHTILYIIIFVTATTFLLAAVSDHFMTFMSFFKSYLLNLQGCWFYQVGFVLFGPHPWKNTPGNVEFLGIAFGFHVFVLFVVHLIGHTICYHCYIKRKRKSGTLLEDSSGEDAVLMMLEQS